MADITITINDPILQGTEKFRFRYRLLPAGIFSPFTDQTNAPFTLLGLSPGNYQYEALFVTEDDIECPAITGLFTVIPQAECLEFAADIVVMGGIYYIQVNYTIPSPFIDFPCGHNFYYRPAGTGQPFQNLSKPVLPAPPMLIQVDPNTAYDFIIRGNLCDNTVICFEDTLEPPIVTCTPRVLNIGLIQLIDNGATPGGSGDRNLTLVIGWTESTPTTTTQNWQVPWQQTGVLLAPNASGVQSYLANQPPQFTAGQINCTISFPIRVRHRNPAGGYFAPGGQISITGSLPDICGTSNTFNVGIQIE